jgi:hypothetical protein
MSSSSYYGNKEESTYALRNQLKKEFKSGNKGVFLKSSKIFG